MKRVLWSSPCVCMISCILHNSPLSLVPLLGPLGTQGNWAIESKSSFPEVTQVINLSGSYCQVYVSLTTLCLSEVSLTGLLKVQGELVKWGFLWVSGGGCHFHVLSTTSGRVTQSSTAVGWTASSLCGAAEFLLTASVLLSIHPITSHPAWPSKILALAVKFFLTFLFIPIILLFNLPANVDDSAFLKSF